MMSNEIIYKMWLFILSHYINPTHAACWDRAAARLQYALTDKCSKGIFINLIIQTIVTYISVYDTLIV